MTKGESHCDSTIISCWISSISSSASSKSIILMATTCKAISQKREKNFRNKYWIKIVANWINSRQPFYAVRIRKWAVLLFSLCGSFSILFFLFFFEQSSAFISNLFHLIKKKIINSYKLEAQFGCDIDFRFNLANKSVQLRIKWNTLEVFRVTIWALTCCVRLSIPLNTSPNEPFPILSCFVNISSGSTFCKENKRKKNVYKYVSYWINRDRVYIGKMQKLVSLGLAEMQLGKE